MSFGKQALGALKQAGVNAIGGLPQFAFSVGTSLLNNHLANKNAEKQYQRQLDFWDLQNEYNSPSQQRRRLELAGLNPAILAGDISSNNTAGSLSSVPGNEYAQEGVFDIDALSNAMTAFKTLENIGANTGLLSSQIELSILEKIIKDHEAFGLDLDNQQKQKLLQYLDEEKRATIDGLLAKARKDNAEADDLEATRPGRLSGMEDEHALSVAQTSLFNAQLAYQKAVNDNLPAQQKAELQAKLSQASANYASAMASRAQAAYNKQLTSNASNDDARKAAEHAIEIQILDYAKQVGASEAQIAQLKAYTESLWAGQKNDYTWSDVGNMLLNFVHENLNLSGGAGYKFGN